MAVGARNSSTFGELDEAHPFASAGANVIATASFWGIPADYLFACLLSQTAALRSRLGCRLSAGARRAQYTPSRRVTCDLMGIRLHFMPFWA